MKPSLSVLLFAMGLSAQRAFEDSGRVVYEDAAKHRFNLGSGFNPLLIAGGKVAFIRGARYAMGDHFDCAHAETRNSVEVYDPRNKRTTTIFDLTLNPREDTNMPVCVYEQMQLSPSAATLYLIIPFSMTAGALAMVDLSNKSVRYLRGINLVYVIQIGPHREELIYQRRIVRDSPAYPFIHARANGKQIAEISDE